MSKLGTSKKEKLILLGLNILVIAVSAVISAVSTGQLGLAPWIVTGLIAIATAVRLTVNGWSTK